MTGTWSRDEDVVWMRPRHLYVNGAPKSETVTSPMNMASDGKELFVWLGDPDNGNRFVFRRALTGECEPRTG